MMNDRALFIGSRDDVCVCVCVRVCVCQLTPDSMQPRFPPKKRWWKNHLLATMHHWADKELHWLWLDDDNFEDKVVEEQEKANPNLNEAESASAGQ